ncbi:MAG: hypothetical protein AVDCRST_MAG50-148 [uncultured Acidimicrobiales bacterium]|uniref:Uncharacterized protein n=1 Tax=uncultured Acidimicrobiales bacterium TaxID=310071 RepID=A0A6J4H2J0_9ACTN|nr:MAG: hypothetical protein AVDCRST_MAG50-148 [uncultured Acidimicrobiales bacterium]
MAPFSPTHGSVIEGRVVVGALSVPFLQGDPRGGPLPLAISPGIPPLA